MIDEAKIEKSGSEQEGTMPATEDVKEKTVPKLKVVKRVKDAVDIESLFESPSLGDDITETHRHDVPIGKPRDFFRTHPDKGYRQRTEIYTHKVEGVIEVSHFIIGPKLRGRLEEARPCVLVVVVDREGNPRLWAIPLPKDGEKDVEAWKSARWAAGKGIKKWIKILWSKRSYITREAKPGYAPDPDFSKLPAYFDLVKLAFGEAGIINDEDHYMWRELVGAAPERRKTDEDDSESI
jgi:hypothetical protein